MRVALMLAIGAAGLIQAAAAEPRSPDWSDEVALRYYASQKQADRVEAEMGRLRRRYARWQPPADLWTAEPGGEDEEAFWDLLAAGRLAEMHLALAERARAEPGWKPSTQLANNLAQRELRIEALALAKSSRWIELAALADSRRNEIEAGDAELGWATAEAWGRTERGPAAYALLKRMMESPRLSPEERRVSVLRAMTFLSMGDVDRLVALGLPGDFDAIRIDLIRGRISAVLHDEAGQSVLAEDLSIYEAYADNAADANEPALVAWHAFKRRDFPVALSWFKRAISRGGDAMVAHGLAHTLRQLGLRREAEDVAYAWREPLVNNLLLFIDLLEADLTREDPPVIEPGRLMRYAQVTAATASGEGAQALAWYAYNNCQFDTALEWFRRAVAWFPKEATVYGYALTLRRMRQQRTFIEVVNRYDGLFPKVVDLLFQAPGAYTMPCEQAPAKVAALPVSAAQASGYLDLATRPEPVVAAGLARRGRVPGPGDVAGVGAATPQVRRSDFPVAVLMENDLRVAPSGRPDTAIGELRWPDRLIGRPPTIARRVPGAGPMPYEHFGFSLKPAWNGEDAPSAPTAAEKPAPIGTVWADERSSQSAALDQQRASEPGQVGRADVARIESIQPHSPSPRRFLP